jgi:hypothetical protein
VEREKERNFFKDTLTFVLSRKGREKMREIPAKWREKNFRVNHG